MSIENGYLSQVPFPIKVAKPEYERGEELLVPPLELCYPDEPYRLRRLALPSERAAGVYAVETLVNVEETEEVGQCYAVTFSWGTAEEAPARPGQDTDTELEEETRPETTVILSAAGFILKDSMSSGQFKQQIRIGYFLDEDGDRPSDTRIATEQNSMGRSLAKISITVGGALLG